MPAWARGLAIARGELPLPMKPPTELTASEQITLSSSVGGPAHPDDEVVGGGVGRPTNRSGDAAASIAPAGWRATGPYPDLNHAPASHAPASHAASHEAASHAPASHARQTETDRQRNARLAMTARGHAPAASVAGHKLVLAGHAPASHTLDSHAESHADSHADSHVDSHAPASHAPDSHSLAATHGLGLAPDGHAPASPAPPPLLSGWPLSTEQLPLSWVFCVVFFAGLAVGRLMKGRAMPWAKKTKLIADKDGNLWPQRDLSV